MTTVRAELLDIIRIGHIIRIGYEVSMRGAGISLRDALRRARYVARRPSFEAADIRPLLEADHELSEAWFAYSEDKRTTRGWYILRSGEIGRVEDPEARRRFNSPEDAIAEYVVRELDFWAGEVIVVVETR